MALHLGRSTVDTALEIRGKLRVVGTQRVLYYLEGENGERDGPFCSICYDIDSKLVRVEAWSDGRHVCAFCNKFRNKQRS